MNSWYAAQFRGIGLNVETGVFLAQLQFWLQYAIVASFISFPSYPSLSVLLK